MRRVEVDVRRSGRRVVVYRRRPVVWRLCWILLAIPVTAGVLAEAWRAAGVAARPAVPVAVVALAVLGAGAFRRARGGRR